MKTKRYFKLLLKPYRIMLKEFDQDIRISIGAKFCCFPQLEEKGRQQLYDGWKRAVKATEVFAHGE